MNETKMQCIDPYGNLDVPAVREIPRIHYCRSVFEEDSKAENPERAMRMDHVLRETELPVDR